MKSQKTYSNGCEKVSDAQSTKMQLRSRTGPPSAESVRRSLTIVSDDREPLSHRVFALQSLAHAQAPDAEDALLRIVTQKDVRLGFPALKTLAMTGTPRTYEALDRLGPLPVDSMDRQKDFARLLIGYRHNLPGTEPILERLQRDARATTGKREEFALRFTAMSSDTIKSTLQHSADADSGIPLSKNLGFQVEAGGQRYFFSFNKKLEDPATWEQALRSKQVIGQLFRQEPGTNIVSQHYVALATPVNDTVQISFFRRDGELFMLANIIYDRAKNTFVVNNPPESPAGSVSRADFRPDERTGLSMNLSYIRRRAKKAAINIE